MKVQSELYWRIQQRKAKRDPIGVIRQELAIWGFPVENMTDEEIEQMVMNFGKAIASTGVTSKQMLNNIQLAFGVTR